MPCAYPRFFSPVDLAPAEFLRHWRGFGEVQRVFRGVIDAELLGLAGLRHLRIEGADCGAAKDTSE